MTAKPKKDSLPGYEIVVQGQYYSINDNGIRTKKFYKNEKFFLPKEIDYAEGREKVDKVVNGKTIKVIQPKIVRANSLRVAQHIIRRYHIEARLKEKLPDYTGVCTMDIFSKEAVDVPADDIGDITKKPVKSLTESELLQLVAIKGINITLSQYIDLGDKKMAVEMALKKKLEDGISAGTVDKQSKEAMLLTEPTGADLF